MANMGKQYVSSRQGTNLGQRKSIFEPSKFPQPSLNITPSPETTDLSGYRQPQPGEMMANVMDSLSTSKSASPPNYITGKQLPAPKRQEKEVNMASVNQLKAPPRPSNLSEKSIQKQEESIPNQTGLPDNLKAGIENLSGYSLDDVRVHYNSSKPAQLQALAYTQGTEIHVAPGQEKHLPHEAWHVVQQMQGRVKPTMQMKGVQINDDNGLEKEADIMGKKNEQLNFLPSKRQSCQSKAMNLNYSTIVQRVVYPNMAAMWAAVHPGYTVVNIHRDSVLSELYNDAAAQLPNCDFVQSPGTAPQISPTPGAAQSYRIEWDTAANLDLDEDYFASAIIHELAHAASSQQYRRNGVNQNEFIWANMNLPPAEGVVDPTTGITPNQLQSYQRQMQTLEQNWMDLEAEAMADNISRNLPDVDYAHISNRIQYALATAFVHNDTVLGDMMYYLKAKNLDNTRTYKFARRMLKEANDRRRNGFWSRNDTEVRVVDRRAWWFQFWKW